MVTKIINLLLDTFEELQNNNIIIDKKYLERHIKKGHPILEFILVENNKVLEKWYFKATFGLTREYNFVEPRFIEKTLLMEYQEQFLKTINNSKFLPDYLGKTDNFYRIKWYKNNYNVSLKDIVNNKKLMYDLKKDVITINKNISSKGIGVRFFLSEFIKTEQFLSVDFNLITSFQYQCFSKILFSFILNYNDKDFYFTILNDIDDEEKEDIKETCFLFACVQKTNLENQWIFMNFKDFFKLNYNDLEKLTNNITVPSLCLLEPSSFTPIKYYEDKKEKMLEIFNIMKGIR